jgi:hypothetical protein
VNSHCKEDRSRNEPCLFTQRVSELKFETKLAEVSSHRTATFCDRRHKSGSPTLAVNFTHVEQIPHKHVIIFRMSKQGFGTPSADDLCFWTCKDELVIHLTELFWMHLDLWQGRSCWNPEWLSPLCSSCKHMGKLLVPLSQSCYRQWVCELAM